MGPRLVFLSSLGLVVLNLMNALWLEVWVILMVALRISLLKLRTYVGLFLHGVRHISHISIIVISGLWVDWSLILESVSVEGLPWCLGIVIAFNHHSLMLDSLFIDLDALRLTNISLNLLGALIIVG